MAAGVKAATGFEAGSPRLLVPELPAPAAFCDGFLHLRRDCRWAEIPGEFQSCYLQCGSTLGGTELANGDRKVVRGKYGSITMTHDFGSFVFLVVDDFGFAARFPSNARPCKIMA